MVDSTAVSGHVTAIVRKFDGFDKKLRIHVDGTNHDYFLAKYKKKKHWLCFWDKNLLTDAGRDQMHSQCINETVAANTERGGGYIASTTNASAASASDTVLTGELGGGLARADATTNTHTGGTNSSTLAKTFTAAETDTAVHKAGTFDASSSGTMYFEKVFAADATLVSGDTLTITWTITIG